MGGFDDVEDNPRIPLLMNFVIGGTSGMCSICIVQPMDLVKTRMQLMGPAGKNVSVGATMKSILKQEGITGFYTGLSAALFRQATYTTGRLGCFNGLFTKYKEKFGEVPSFPIKLLMGMTAGAMGGFLGTPAEVALIRMTADGRLPADKRRNYKHVFNALGRITREEGLTKMWRGAAATMVRAAVVNGAALGTYSQAREVLLPTFGETIVLHFFASMIAGLIATAASLPVDIIKTRVQNSAHGASQLSVLRHILKTEGVLALWCGFLPTYGKFGPHTVFTFIFMEQFNELYLKHYG